MIWSIVEIDFGFSACDITQNLLIYKMQSIVLLTIVAIDRSTIKISKVSSSTMHADEGGNDLIWNSSGDHTFHENESQEAWFRYLYQVLKSYREKVTLELFFFRERSKCMCMCFVCPWDDGIVYVWMSIHKWVFVFVQNMDGKEPRWKWTWRPLNRPIYYPPEGIVRRVTPKHKL